MSDNEDRLETRLLELGSLERKIEELIRELRAEAKVAIQAGDLGQADALCNTMDELRTELGPLVSEIIEIERQLYGMRRRRK